MSEYPVSSSCELKVGTWPDRKRPSLYVYDPQTNCCHILACFKSQAAADEFMEIAKRGIFA